MYYIYIIYTYMAMHSAYSLHFALCSCHYTHVYLHTVTLATDSDGQARSLVKPILIGPRAT